MKTQKGFTIAAFSYKSLLSFKTLIISIYFKYLSYKEPAMQC